LKNLAFIPARSGSTQVKDKNIKLLNNVPLICFTVFIAQKAKQLGLFDEIFVSTDSMDYLNLLNPFNYEEAYLRPSELSRAESHPIDAVIDGIKYLEKKKQKFDNVMILQPVSPFRNVQQIVQALDLLEKNKEATCVTTVNKLGDLHPARIKKIEDGYLKDFNKDSEEIEPSRRQDFKPDAYVRSGSIYLSKTKQIIEEKKIRGDRVIPLEVSEFYSINIDKDTDFFLAEAMINSKLYERELLEFTDLFDLYKQ
jgi:CMP-N,N'-diacetyllegionaminic acid synthase|tara:strand:+ start:391 stop:1152 length:762 start_codon:yes stop_codon:yes gene_type:complete